MMMEKKTNIGKSAFTDFYILYDHYNGRNYHCPKDIAKAHNDIGEAYGLEGKELQLITHMAAILPNGLSYARIADIIHLSDTDTINSIVDILLSKNIIRIDVSSSRQTYIALTAKAINAFNRYEPFGAFEKIDFIDLLRSTDEEQMNRYEWIRKFKAQIKTNMLSDFVQGWNALKADGLSDNELKTMCIALRQFILHFTEPIRINSSDFKPSIDIDEVTKASAVSKKYIDALVEKGFLMTKGDGYIIAPKVAETLLHGHDEIVNYDEISNRVQVIKSIDIEKRELFFSPESQEEIGHLHFMFSKEGFEHACKVLTKKKRNPAIQSLLWGGPGTGKTETVKQIARETGRDIFLFDVAKVTASDWGATENLYRSLFNSYRYIVAVKTLSPILLINEADQVLSHRLSTLERSIDKAENTVSNILLQEFEDMHGILLATTNNAKLLDEAFDRRFLFKTELQKPDARARKSIWKSLIPELSEKEAELLAEKYVMSGAQINNVATKRDLAELYFLGDRGISYIEKLCDKELSTEKQNKHIGF